MDLLIPFYDSETGDWGYESAYGKIIITPQFDGAEEFHNGYATVKKGEFWGLIDVSGNFIIQPEYNRLFSYSNTWAHGTKDNTEYLLTISGEVVLAISDIIAWEYPEDGLVRVKKKTGWGAMDLKGNILIEFHHISIGPCVNGHLSFYDNGKWGLIDRNGNIVIEPQYKEIRSWCDGYWWGRNDNGYFIFDHTHRIISKEPILKLIAPSIDRAGMIKTNEGWRYVDKHLNKILQLPPLYEWVGQFREGLAPAKKNGLWGFINEKGEEVIDFRFENLSGFSEGLAVVKIGKFKGYIDKSGELVIPLMFEGATSFNDGIAWVRDNWTEWYINKKGEQVTKPKYWD